MVNSEGRGKLPGLELGTKEFTVVCVIKMNDGIMPAYCNCNNLSMDEVHCILQYIYE
jgi:hypothetical protein